MRHVKQAKALRRAVRRKLREKNIAVPVTRSRVDLRGLSPPLNNKVVFEKLLAGMDDIFSNLDGFFREVGMDQMQCPDRKRIAMGNCKGNVVVEFLNTYVVPFGLCQTENVVCNLSRTSSQDKGIFYLQVRHPTYFFSIGVAWATYYCFEWSLFQNFTQGTNTRMISMCFPFTLEGVNFHIVMRIVTRKYVQQNKVVFITRSLIEPIIGTASIGFVETSRMVLKRGNISALGSTTVMQTHREATLSGDVLSLDTTKYPGLEGGIQAWKDTTTDHYHSIEDQLLLTVK